MNRRSLLQLLGSLAIAVPLLIAIAVVLAWGTIYETRFGTASVQRFIYHAWWFQALLAFLAVNLTVSALRRYPWARRHVPFLLAHVGIILILVGGIVGGRFGIEGQLIIPEGGTERVLVLPGNVLVVTEPNPGVPHVFPTRFETTAWVHEPHALFRVPLKDRTLDLVVDRYYPNAEAHEVVTGDGDAENPAVRLAIGRDDEQEEQWLLARDPDRFGVRWQEAHIFFLAPATEEELSPWLATMPLDSSDRGTLMIDLPDHQIRRELPVPQEFDRPVTLEGTPYTVTFKQYFPDFAITEEGVTSQSDQPNNPAVAVTLAGPEGTDARLVFALHPEFDALHAQAHSIHAHLTYRHAAAQRLPPNAVAVIRHPAGGLVAVMTGGRGQQEVGWLPVGIPAIHPWLEGIWFSVAEELPRARMTRHYVNRNDEVKAEALHVVAREGTQTAGGWIPQGGSVTLALGREPVIVGYRPAQRELPVTVKLLDFRKTEYPGTQMASGFESDVELTDAARGVTLTRTIRMNTPLKYRGYTFFQSSYIAGPTETTVLSVRNDPGTPLVYAGFLVVIAGVVTLFLRKPKALT